MPYRKTAGSHRKVALKTGGVHTLGEVPKVPPPAGQMHRPKERDHDQRSHCYLKNHWKHLSMLSDKGALYALAKILARGRFFIQNGLLQISMTRPFDSIQ